MKNNTVITAVFILLLALTSNLLGQGGAAKRVLFLGNSAFYFHGGLCPPFEGFCREAGLDIQAVSQRDTPKNPHGVEFLDYGRIPLTLPEMAADEKIHALIRSGKFDFVILEGRRPGFLLPEFVSRPENGSQPIPYEKNLEGLSSIHRTIVESGAQTVLYMHPMGRDGEDNTHPVAQIYQSFHSGLERMEINGERHKVILVPAIFLWCDAVGRYGSEGWYADAGHGNALARYSSACMLYTYITGEDPRKSLYRDLADFTSSWELIPEEANLLASEEDAKWIKDQVWLYYSTRPL